MRLRPFAIFVVTLLLALAGSLRAADDARFTRTLSGEDFTAAGLNLLNSDQIAILDALVRRDATKLANMRPSQPRPDRFSDRITADERTNAGLGALNNEQLKLLDEKVQQFVSPAPPVQFGATSGGSMSSSSVQSAKFRRELEVHGSVSLMYGVGSHGYTEKGGAMVLSVEDPVSGLALAVGYSEVHTSGGRFLSRCGPGYGVPFAWR
jgi:hypothetical protein